MNGWPFNAQAPARSRRGQPQSAASALVDPPGSARGVRIGGLGLAAIRRRSGRGWTRSTPRQPLADALGREGSASRRAMACGVQRLGHPPGGPTRGLPVLHALPHRRRIGDLLPPPHRSADLMLRHRAAGPMQLHPHRWARRRCPDHHALQQQPHHLALLHHRGRGGLPQSRQIAPGPRSRHAPRSSSAPAAPAGNDGIPPPSSAAPAGPLPRSVPASAPPGGSPARPRCTAERRGWRPEPLAPAAAAIGHPERRVGPGIPGPRRLNSNPAGVTTSNTWSRTNCSNAAPAKL